MKIALTQGACSGALLEDPTFCADWATLCRRCPWSTIYQLPAFVAVWYRIYSGRFDPLLITARNDGSLVGILCLAVSRYDGRIVVAGGPQAEYQTWVCEPDLGEEFPLAAITVIRRDFPGARLEFSYLPPTVPLGWLANSSIRHLALLTPRPRPFLRFADMICDPLNKANNKKRLKGLKKLGDFDFRRLTDPADFAQISEQFAHFYDLRHLAMFAVEPFAADPLQQPFLRELMKDSSLLHVTVMRAGGHLASAQINFRDRGQVRLGLHVYNPRLAKHSPGKFHIHLLAQMLIGEGYESLDLTPGGDPYKERFANARDNAYVLSFFPIWREKAKAFTKTRLGNVARKAFAALPVERARAKAAWHAARELHPLQIAPAMLAGIATRIRRRPQSIVYIAAIPRYEPPNPSSLDFRVDDTRDLMAYRPNPGEISRRRFLSAALERLEEGQHLFSRTEDGRLLQIGWLIERPSDIFLSRIGPGLKLPPKFALITRLQSFCASRETELGTACIAAMQRELRRRGIDGVAMAARHDEARTIRLLESVGFRAERPLKCPETAVVQIQG